MPKIEEATQELLKMMSENSDEEYTVQSIIDNCIDELNNNETEEGNVSVIVSQTNQKLSGITLKNEENEIKLSLIITGIGKQKTAIGLTKYLCENDKPDLIINIGYAGSTSAKIGSWVSINKSYNLEWRVFNS